MCIAAGAAASNGKEMACSTVAEALRRNKLGFGFSAGGLLFPYYVINSIYLARSQSALPPSPLLLHARVNGGADTPVLMAVRWASSISSQSWT